MLTTILNGLTIPKCVIIQDSLAISGEEILSSLLIKHLDLTQCIVHYFAFQNKPNIIKDRFSSSKLIVYDCTINENTWVRSSNKNFDEILEETQFEGVIIIDSLAHVLFDYGLGKTYHFLNQLFANKANKVIQIATILHDDLIQDKHETIQYFDHLATLSIKVIDIPGQNSRVFYTHKRPNGKIIKEVEEYFIDEKTFHTKPIEKIDAKKLFKNTTSGVLPEDMSTFKIGLDEKEKIARDHLVLPYVKTSLEPQSESGGNIIYNLDDEDDWDEEDPDDDLDF